MLQLLIFPDLDYQKQAIIRRKNPKGLDEEAAVYKLNWKWSDDYKRKKWLEFKKENPYTTFTFIDLPEPYNQTVKDSLFLITPNYRNEIIRNFAEATKEWTLNRSFDTNIREMCLQPAISHVKVGFELIGDCLYDERTNYYDRTELKGIIANMLMYKFWCMQTGNGMVRYYSGLEEIGNHQDETTKEFYLTIQKSELHWK
jgi:hypothetical protein